MYLGRHMRVVLLAGSSGAGKTMLAQRLGQHWGISTVMVDDLRLAAQQLTTPAQQPALHYFLTNPDIWELPAEALCAGLIGVAEALAPALAMVMAHHLVVEGAGPLILEGDGILPQLVAPQVASLYPSLTGLPVSEEVRMIVLGGAAEETILQRMRARGRGFDQLAPQGQRNLARASWLYSQWLEAEAQRYNVPVITAQPWPTLLDRVLTTLAASVPP